MILPKYHLERLPEKTWDTQDEVGEGEEEGARGLEDEGGQSQGESSLVEALVKLLACWKQSMLHAHGATAAYLDSKVSLR